MPLGNPDRFFDWLARRAGWLGGPWFALVWIVTLLAGASSVYGQKERFTAQMSGMFDFGNLWILGGLWLVLKAFHECWHGFMCRRFGGAVPEAGLTLLLFTTPLGYVNASSSVAFPSRWHRIAVSAAGMYGELFLAALAAIFWARVAPGTWSEALHQVVVLSSVTTVLFNANPLMRFDGYYLLSDLLDIPNLYGKGQSVANWMFRRWILGMRKAEFPLRRGESFPLIAVYGVAAWVWKSVVFIGIVLALAVLFEGAGLLLAVALLAAAILQSILSAVKYLRKSAASEGLRPVRLVLRLSAGAGLAALVLFAVEVTPSVRAPAVVRDVGGGEIRAACPGFLRDLKVTVGDRVAKGISWRDWKTRRKRRVSPGSRSRSSAAGCATMPSSKPARSPRRWRRRSIWRGSRKPPASCGSTSPVWNCGHPAMGRSTRATSSCLWEPGSKRDDCCFRWSRRTAGNWSSSRPRTTGAVRRIEGIQTPGDVPTARTIVRAARPPRGLRAESRIGGDALRAHHSGGRCLAGATENRGRRGGTRNRHG